MISHFFKLIIYFVLCHMYHKCQLYILIISRAKNQIKSFRQNSKLDNKKYQIQDLCMRKLKKQSN